MIKHNNLTSNMFDGIHFEHTGWEYHNNNIISNNNLSYNNRGIYMIMSADNQILYNNIFSNDKIGIMLDMCEGGGENNVIHHNNLIDNGENQALEYGAPLNYWDDGYPSGGNYWSDYTGEDNDGDGIGDTPYLIPAGVNQDNYPLMIPYKIENTTLEIGYVGAGLFFISAEIKNIGKHSAIKVNWSITLDGSIVLLGGETKGEIPSIPAGVSVTVRSRIIFAFGQTQIIITAEAINAEKVTKIISGYIFFIFIIIN